MSGPAPADPPPLDDENRGPGMIAMTIVVTLMADTTVFMRMWIRSRMIKRVGWDDWTIVAAALGQTLGACLVFVQVHYGFGRHRYYLTKQQDLEFQRYSYAEWIQTFATLMFTKISICFLLLRFTVRKAFIRPIQGFIVILIASNIILTVLWIVQCRPLDEAWNLTVDGTCFSKGQLQRIIIAQANTKISESEVISIISDFSLAAFPILILHPVKIGFRTKVGLCSLMGLGVITGTLCIARTVFNWENVNEDTTWLSINNWYLRSWEVCVGIIAACIPTLRPGYRYIIDRLHSRSSKTQYIADHSSKARFHRRLSHRTGKEDNDPNATEIASIPKAHSRHDDGGSNATTTTEDLITLPLQNFEIQETVRIDVDDRHLPPASPSSANNEQGQRSDLDRRHKGRKNSSESEGRIRGVEDIV